MSLEKSPEFLLNFSVAEMNGKEKPSYRFKSFRLNVAERQLSKNGRSVPLAPKAFDVLAFLVERGGHLVEKDELMQTVWADSFVEEANLARIVHTLRKTLGEDHNGNKYIETVAKKGYRFVAEVEEISVNGAGKSTTAPLVEPSPRNLQPTELTPLSGLSKIVNRDHEAREKDGRPWPRPRTILFLTVGIMIVVSVLGYWFAKNSRIKGLSVGSAAHQSNNGEAYQQYLQGKLLRDRKLKGDLENALANFERAIELDSNYTDAYVGKADVKIWSFWASGSHDDISQARTAINKALDLDPANSNAHTLLCRIKVTYDWDFDGGQKECLRAIELDPNSPDAHTEWALFLKVLGRYDEALAEIDTTIALAPTSFNKRSRGLILYYARRYDEAITQLKQVTETDPDFAMASKWIIYSYEMKKDYDHAFDWYLRKVEQAGPAPGEIEALKAIYERNGWPGILRNKIDSAGNPKSDGKEFSLTETGTMYASLGENDKAFEYLNQAYDRRELFITHIKREPRLDPIRSDPRFDELVKRIGSP